MADPDTNMDTDAAPTESGVDSGAAEVAAAADTADATSKEADDGPSAVETSEGPAGDEPEESEAAVTSVSELFGDDDDDDDEVQPVKRKRLKKMQDSDSDDDDDGDTGGPAAKDDDAAGNDDPAADGGAEDGGVLPKNLLKKKKKKDKKDKKEKKKDKKEKKSKEMEELFGDDSDEDDEIDGVDEGEDSVVDQSNIVEGKRGQAPKEKKKKKKRPASDIPDDNGAGFLDDDDLDDNMRGLVDEYNEEREEFVGSEAEEDNMDEEQQRKADDAWSRKNDKNDIDSMLGISSKKVSRKIRSEGERKNDSLMFIEEVKEAAERDRDDIERGRPALRKIRLLPKISQAMKKKDIVGILMDNDILGALKQYLEPIDDQGTLPALDLRTTLLDILLSPDVLSITEVWQLEKSRIGEDVYRLKDHPKETKDNRRKAAKVVERWYRMLTGTSENMKDLSRIEEERSHNAPLPIKKKRKTSNPDEDAMETTRTQQNGSWMHIKMPFAEGSYVRRPKTSADVEISALKNVKTKNKDDKSRADRLKDQVKNGKGGKRSKVGQRAQDISIEGRGMEKFI